MPAKPPIVENRNPDIESMDACHKLGTNPPSVPPTNAPIQISRLDAMRAPATVLPARDS